MRSIAGKNVTMTLSPSITSAAYVGLTLSAIYTLSRWFKSRSGLKLPPGPKRRFLIGNLLDMPKEREWLTFDRWAKEYGDLVYVSMLGTSVLFVNSYEIAQELFEKRGSIYSDRYQSTVITEMLNFDWLVTAQQYGDKWRRHRAFFNQFFHQPAIRNYHDVQQRSIKTLLQRLHQSPHNFMSHIRFVLGSLVLEVAYGIRPHSESDQLLVLSESTISKVTEIGVPGTFLVDILPFLKHVPSWFPGAGYKTVIDRLRKQIFEMVNSPIETVKAAMSNGDAVSSVASSLIEQFANNPDRPSDYEDIIKHISGAVYIAGVDTTDSVTLHFFLAMVSHPDVQKKAQAELDSVIGPNALPSFHDRQNLPYIKAVVKEVLRWNAVLNVGLPHVLTTDDTIGGYFIPKGTIIFGNSWTLLRSKSVYGEDADKFRPERFMNGDVPDPDYAFGYGRRICPGQYFAESTMFILIASVLQVYNILPIEGGDDPEYPKEEFCSGILLRPKPFQCRIVPRSSAALKLLEELDL